MDIYHIVLVTKYRRPVLTGPVKDLVYRVIQDIFDEKKLVILEMNGEADHIHILFEADPFTAPGTLVNIIKTKTSRYARKEYGETFLKEYYWKPLVYRWYRNISKTSRLCGIHPRPCGAQLLWTWYSA